jgi:tetratricopeptide (TPR) repeat protein
VPLPLFHRLRTSRGVARDFRAALVLQQQERLPQAEGLYRAILQRDPDHVQALYNLGLVRVRQGGLDDALGLFGEALCRRQDFAEAHNALGIALRLSGRHEEALAHYAQALAIKPGYAEVENNIGLALQARGRWPEAVGHFERAIAINPVYADAENNLGAALRALHRYEEAVEHYRRALAAKPNSAVAHSNLGAALQLLVRHDEALAQFDRALAMAPELAEAHHGRGTVLRTLGRLEEAGQALERAVALAPRRAEFYRSLAESKRFVEGDRHRALIEALACDMASLSQEEQVHLHFALGKVYADVGEHQRSFDHLLKGNALKRTQIVYDEGAALERLDRTRELFSAEIMRERAGQGDPSPVPVFILGMPRSGTTLVEQMLASHPQVHGAGELSDFAAVVAALGGPDGVPDDIRGAELRRIGARYVARVGALARSARHITDKMPANFRFAGLIHLALPNARIIHLSRDPVDTCLSCFSILFGGDQPYTYDLGELGRYYRAYQTLMAHWRDVLPPGVMLEVQYEELVGDFEPQARHILAHCDLDWDDACLDFPNTRRPVHTASAVQVRQPVYQTSVGRWRPPEDVLRPLLDALGRD